MCIRDSFIRFALAKAGITYGMELMLALFNIVQGTIGTIMTAAGFTSAPVSYTHLDVYKRQVLDYTTNPEKTANPEYSAEDYQALKDVLAYAKDEEKTEHEFFCDGINCNVAMARDQFITVKEQFGKTDGIQAYHGYLSFKENEVTPEQDVYKRQALYRSSFSLTEGFLSAAFATPLSVCVPVVSESRSDRGLLSVFATEGFWWEFPSFCIGFPIASSTMISPLDFVGTSLAAASRSATSFSASETMEALSTLPSSKRSEMRWIFAASSARAIISTIAVSLLVFLSRRTQ